MINTYVKEKLKASIPIEAVAEHLGLIEKLRMRTNAGTLSGNCITGHLSDSGTCFKLHKHANQFHCFNCGDSFDAIELVEKEKGLSYPEACVYLAEVFRRDLLDELQKTSLISSDTKEGLHPREEGFETIHHGSRISN